MDQRHVGRGAAHIEGNAVADAGHLAHPDRAADTAHRSRQERAGRELGRLGERHHAAVRAHDADRSRHPLSFQLVRQRDEIGAHDRRQIGVEHAGREALELALFAHHRGRCTDRHVAEHGAQHLGRPALVFVVYECVDEADRHRLDSIVPEAVGDIGEIVVVDRAQHLAVGGNALRYFDPEAAIDQRLGTDKLDVEQATDQAPRAADLERIAKPFGGDQRGPRARALHQRVGGDCGAVDEGVDRAVIDAELGERVQNSAPLAAWQRRHLGRLQRVRHDVEAEHVGERPADVDADNVAWIGHIRLAEVYASPRGSRRSRRSPRRRWRNRTAR